MTDNTAEIAPQQIEARQLTEDADWEEIAQWCNGAVRNYLEPNGEQYTTLALPWYISSAGIMHCEAVLGDWVIVEGGSRDLSPVYVVECRHADAILSVVAREYVNETEVEVAQGEVDLNSPELEWPPFASEIIYPQKPWTTSSEDVGHD